MATVHDHRPKAGDAPGHPRFRFPVRESHVRHCDVGPGSPITHCGFGDEARCNMHRPLALSLSVLTDLPGPGAHTMQPIAGVRLALYALPALADPSAQTGKELMADACY